MKKNKLYNLVQLCLTASVLFLNSCGNDKKDGRTNGFCTDYIPLKSRLKEKNIDSMKISNFTIKSGLDEIRKLENGSTLNVLFFDGTENIQNEVLKIAVEWSKYCNIKFQKTSDYKYSDIRISFRKVGYWSTIGTDAYRADTTMSLQDLDLLNDPIEFKRVVLHEFGHALGLIHEHQSPASKVNWNVEAVYKYYSLPPNKWDHKTVDEQIFKKYNSTLTNYSAYDPNSIMHYPIPSELTTDGYKVDWNNDLSITDKKHIARLYPF